MDTNNKKVAVFIDAENIGFSNADQIFDEASSYGDVIIKKIYGDWSKDSLKPWKDMISKYSLVAEQQFSFASSKNSSDISLMIQVLLALFEKNIDVFCIVTGDSDFTRLVQELREREKVVVGMGRRNSIQSFVNAFSEFIYLGENKIVPEAPIVGTAVVQKPQTKVKPKIEAEKCILDNKQLATLTEILDAQIDNNGKALYSQISNEMKKRYSDFIPKNYGCRSMKEFIQKLLPFLKKYVINVEKDKTTMYLERKDTHNKVD